MNLPLDILQEILSYSDSPNTYKSWSLVCKNFNTANQRLKVDKSIQFCTPHKKCEESYFGNKDGRWYEYKVTNYYRLPCGLKHSKSVTQVYLRRAFGNFEDPPKTIIQYFEYGVEK